MKSIISILILLIPFFTNGQSRIDSLFALGDTYFQEKKYDKAKEVYSNLKSELDRRSNDYKYAADQIAMIYFFGRENLRKENKFEESNKYINDFLEYIENEKGLIRPLWNDDKRYFLIKTIIQNHFSLNQYEEASKYQEILYNAYRDKKLPEGINEFYSFDMFKWEDKNVWGYEWFAELGTPETEGSFSKIVYYVFSTDEKGNDKEQLYRFHVLKVHKIDDDMPDYVLTKRLESAKNEVSGTFWSYTYNSPIDYSKLKIDIQEVLKGNYEPKAKSNISKKKN